MSIHKKSNHKTRSQSESNKDIQRIYDKNGKYLETIVDRNHDGRPDQWFYYSGDTLLKVVEDANLDGKEDMWTTMVGIDSSITEIDADSNGISDETAYYKYQICQDIIFHPNGSKPTQLFHQKAGLLDYVLFSADSSGEFHKFRKFDKNGNIVKEGNWSPSTKL
jgi:hypothetical protein